MSIAEDLQKAIVLHLTEDEDAILYPPSWLWGEVAEMREEVIQDFGTVSSVYYRGGEGQGDSLYFVLKLVTDDGEELFFRADGYYSSYDGTNWDDAELYEVKPREKTIIVYEKVR